MTRLEGSRTVTRESMAMYRRRAIVATLTAHTVTLRLKGTRDRVELPLVAALEAAYRLRYLEQRREKQQQKRRHA